MFDLYMNLSDKENSYGTVYRKYNITGSIITPMACVFLIFAYEAIIPIGVDIKNTINPNQPVNMNTITDSPQRTAAHNFE